MGNKLNALKDMIADREEVRAKGLEADPMPGDHLGLEDEHRSPENLKRLTDLHLLRYRTMLKRALMGDTGLRAGELKHLVACWEGVELKKHRWDDLAPEERSEVYDAVMSDE